MAPRRIALPFSFANFPRTGIFFQMLPGKVWEVSIKDNASPPPTPEGLPV
jgi:hypothetical protein